MIKYFFTCCIFFIVNQLSAQQDTVFTVIDSEKGIVAFETLNSDMTLDKGRLKNKQLHDNLMHYFPNGVLMGMTQYRNGKKDGIQLYFEKSGLLLKEENYKNDTLHGEVRVYFTSENVRILKQSQHYVNGKLDGLWTENNNMGKTISAEEYKAGVKNGKSIWFYNSGKPAMEQYYVNGVLHGAQVVYNMNGDIISKGQNTEGSKSGLWYEYHDNGKVKSEGNFSQDRKTGKWKYFDENGQLINEENY